jgi:hypothetical protein
MWRYILLLFIAMALAAAGSSSRNTGSSSSWDSGPEAMREGERLFQEGLYEAAAPALWRAVLLHEQTPSQERYDVQRAFQLFLGCYAAQNRVVDGLVFVAEESFRRGQSDMGQKFLEQVLAVDPSNKDARRLQETYHGAAAAAMGASAQDVVEPPPTSAAQFDDEMMKKTPEELYQMASEHFSAKQYEVL